MGEMRGYMFIRLFAVIVRDLKKFQRNPVVLAMSLVMPILYLIILGNSFQGKITGLPIVVVNQDTGPYSRQAIENLMAIEAGPKVISVFYIKDQGAALDGVKKGMYKAALIIPPDFSKSVALKRQAEIGLFVDNTDGVSAEAVRNTIDGALRFVRQEYVGIRERQDAIYLRGIDLYRKVDYYQSLVPGVVIMAIFLGTMTTGAFNLVMDRFLGVDESYLLTPLSKSHIVSGLVISGLFLTTIIAGVVFAVSMWITGIPISKGIEQCASLFVIITLTTLGLLSMMFVILGRVNHPRIVGILSGFLNVILFFPSGAVYPVESFPEWLKAFAKINPEAYSVSALKSILFKNANLNVISGEIAFLTIFAIIMMTLAIIVFKRTL